MVIFLIQFEPFSCDVNAIVDGHLVKNIYIKK